MISTTEHANFLLKDTYFWPNLDVLIRIFSSMVWILPETKEAHNKSISILGSLKDYRVRSHGLLVSSLALQVEIVELLIDTFPMG